MASRKLLLASIGVAATTFGFGCASSTSGNCCGLPEDSGDIVDTLLDSQSRADSAHDTIGDLADSSADTEATDGDATDTDATSGDSSVDALDAEASRD